MFTFAEIPVGPPFWISKMAAIKYIFGHICAFNHHKNFLKYANPMFSGTRNPMKVSNKCYEEQ